MPFPRLAHQVHGLRGLPQGFSALSGQLKLVPDQCKRREEQRVGRGGGEGGGWVMGGSGRIGTEGRDGAAFKGVQCRAVLWCDVLCSSERLLEVKA